MLGNRSSGMPGSLRSISVGFSDETDTELCTDCSVSISENVGKLEGMLAKRGISRRQFLQFCSAVAVALGLSEAFAPTVQEVLADGVVGKASGRLAPVIWLELASCTGCTESFAQVDTPDIATVVLELISLNYSETLSAGAGYSLEEAKAQTIAAGGHIVVIEGALMEGWNGDALRIAGERGTDIVLHAIHNAAAIVCAGSCSVDGGWQAAKPNPGGAIGIQNFLNKALAAGKIDVIPPIINIPTCPSNPEHMVTVLVDVLLLGTPPQLNRDNKPSLIFDQFIHDNCPRRGHFENGRFVYQFGSKEERLGYCLYAMGCKGPQTKSNCPIVRWNRRVSWCVEAGAPCIGCATANPKTTKQNWVDTNSPFFRRFHSINVFGRVLPPEIFGLAVGGVVLGALAVHGIGWKISGRFDGGAPYEKERAWDIKHPDRAISRTVLQQAAKNDRALSAMLTMEDAADRYWDEVTETAVEAKKAAVPLRQPRPVIVTDGDEDNGSADFTMPVAWQPVVDSGDDAKGDE
jgi:hydrogenase small subunit